MNFNNIKLSLGVAEAISEIIISMLTGSEKLKSLFKPKEFVPRDATEISIEVLPKQHREKLNGWIANKKRQFEYVFSNSGYDVSSTCFDLGGDLTSYL